jgi:hypothetical protein
VHLICRDGIIPDMKIDPRLGDVVVKDVDGNPVRLGSLWEKGPAVLIFVRHYG